MNWDKLDALGSISFSAGALTLSMSASSDGLNWLWGGPLIPESHTISMLFLPALYLHLKTYWPHHYKGKGQSQEASFSDVVLLRIHAFPIAAAWTFLAKRLLMEDVMGRHGGPVHQCCVLLEDGMPSLHLGRGLSASLLGYSWYWPARIAV